MKMATTTMSNEKEKDRNGTAENMLKFVKK
jgi:hypothetical protein